MRKLIAFIAVIAVALTASADLRGFTGTSLGLAPGGDGSEMQNFDVYLGGSSVNYSGADWVVGIFNDASWDALNPVATLTGSLADSNTGALGGWGWYDGYGYTITGFGFTEQELDDVVLVLFNSNDATTATHALSSAPYTLPDLTDPILPGADEVTFNFTGSTWQAVPEPATIGLFGLGALSAWILRRSKKQA